MARKVYKAGDRANVYIKKDISEEMIDFINKQSDLTMFFLYAAQQLHKQIGDTDVAEILPRKYTFSLDAETKTLITNPDKGSNLVHSPVLNQIHVETNQETTKPGESHNDEEENKSWNKLDDLNDDPYA
ncbi:hypothetical protein P4G85_22300 [Bacillus cereus]|uniref:Group-specific protein n=2 Tax=Bacillus cereus group TaxID=86661 RepID=A0A9W5KRG8_BACCE|nr:MULTISPECIES: hypothetical protein [Bacillus cereus group]MEB8734179.1 hypothetical protein [Bacillus cereus]EEM48117.1 hypothetical protein bthur0005_19790 [Bacillus thuringiensis serovar pakistani str. T13001]EJR64168.1 hypothetical protein IK5_05773 [Bacillus cereus VD154]KIU73161.1 group-specific protein [Bacillus thuringiensis Sbt003]MEB8751042.1 hypothetical protein [Bacillus cereus]